MNSYAKQTIKKVAYISLIIFLFTTLFSCSLNIQKTSQISIDTNSIIQAISRNQEAPKGPISIKATVSGKNVTNNSQTIENIQSEDQINGQQLIFDALPVGETVTISVQVFINNKEKYYAEKTQIISENEADNTIELTLKKKAIYDIYTTPELSNSVKIVFVEVPNIDEIEKVVYIKGNYTDTYDILNNGTDITETKSEGKFSFRVSDNDVYSVAIKDKYENQILLHIEITQIDKEPPAEVTELKAEWDEETSTLTLSWTNPTDDFDHVEIDYRKEEDNQKSDTTYNNYYTITSNTITTCTYIIKTVDKAGNKSNEITGEFKRIPSVSSNGTFYVGDLILTNGNVIRYNDKNALEAYKPYTNQAVAVIFRATNGENPALGVGVRQQQGAWANSSTIGYSTNYADLQCNIDGSNTTTVSYNDWSKTLSFGGTTDGINNWMSIINYWNTSEQDSYVAQGRDLSSYPVFYFAENYATTYSLTNDSHKTKWYVPTVAEFDEIYNNIETVNRVLKALGGVVTSDKNGYCDTAIQAISPNWYWTSSQSGTNNYAFYYYPNTSPASWDRKIEPWSKSENECLICVVHQF